jgi:hypothetical protein
MLILKNLFQFINRIVVALLVIAQLTFVVKFLSRCTKQGIGAALSYLRGDYIVVQSSRDAAIAIMPIRHVHPYLTFALTAVCLLGATLLLLWLDRKIRSTPRSRQKLTLRMLANMNAMLIAWLLH